MAGQPNGRDDSEAGDRSLRRTQITIRERPASELGAFGSDGWLAKHSLGDDITVLQNIENHLKGIIDTMRIQRRLGPKGVDDVTGDNWKRPRIAPWDYPG